MKNYKKPEKLNILANTTENMVKLNVKNRKIALKYLTLYAFSFENWRRPVAEINFLMRILHKYIRREKENLVRQNIKFDTLGDLTQLPSAIVREVEDLKELTKNNTGLN